ncbi:MAG TPA: DNA oxidative demethylase AlkB [Nitrosospira sp.]|nr:DNA oxidative demethylase AlkB [Nitrosospira sp.]
MIQFDNEPVTLALFQDEDAGQWLSEREELCPGAVVLRRLALPYQAEILDALQAVTAEAPFRRMSTPGGFRMSVALTNCGSCGWVSDRTGYRYDAIDPESGKPWPRIPPVFLNLVQHAASLAGFENYRPDACLVNRYEPGARLSLHQDKDEHDLSSPIVSVSLGIPAVFLWGGLRREHKTMRIPLGHGDVVAWGGPARLRYHGVLPVKEGYHSFAGRYRINLTFRSVTLKG